MKKITFTLLIAAIFGISVSAQDTESYTALKVTGDQVPVIDGTIDAIWNHVETVPLTKVPKKNGVIHENIFVPNPDPSDFSAEFGMLWNEDGMYFIFSVTDDKIVIYEDYYTDNDTPADKWWYDDNINLLFSKDLVNIVFTQWEFAWQPGINQEEKLSSDDWANPALIDISLVKSAWYNDGNLWILETFIDWEAFADGNALITPDMIIFMEARARDDDDDYAVGNLWESMFQWSTDNYLVEDDGTGMGSVTLSSTEVEPVGVADAGIPGDGGISIFPNPSRGFSDLQLTLLSGGDVSVAVSDLSGKIIDHIRYGGLSSGEHILPVALTTLPQGIYFLHVSSASESTVLKYVRQ
jgi:hypothetical protein